MDYLIKPTEVQHKTYEMLFLGALFVSFGVGVEYFLPELHGSIIIFAMIPAIPLMLSLLLREEREDEKCRSKTLREAIKLEGSLFSRHARIIKVFSFFFLGAVIAYTFWFVALPPDLSASMFTDQIAETKVIQGMASAWFFNTQTASFLFAHNIQVLALMFLFCLFYGVGSLYLLLWNASILGVVLGQKIIAQGPVGFITGFLGLLPHGSFEIAAYFIASIAGGIMSMALMRSKCKRAALKQVAVDVVTLAAIAVILIAIGSVLESAY
ncbi:MAG: stage II sporulation protein M [Candidatus Micrarchaeota archaeon]